MPKHGIFTETTKWCNRCAAHKPHADFHKSNYTQTGLSVYCAKCMRKSQDNWRRKNLDKAAKYQRDARKRDSERFHDYGRKQNYGLKPGQYANMLAAQGGKCRICGSKEPSGKGKNFHVDHCHDTRIVRGLLCHNCNVGLGHFQSSPELLAQAISYLAEACAKVG